MLLNVAFLTLIERKVLGIRQIRVGPNKIGAWGVLQPAADAVKLFTNRLSTLGPMNKLVYFGRPVLRLFLTLSFLILISPAKGGLAPTCGVLLLIILLRLNIYPLIGAGWGSGRKYARLGGLRGIAQTIAYEISLAFLCLAIFSLWRRRRLLLSSHPGGLNRLFILIRPVFIIWRVTCVAELNRTPFDFAEGESELVSGFNVEYGSVKFAIIFIAEYGIIYFFRVLRWFLFRGARIFSVVTILGGVLLSRVTIWIRATLPRFRYDLLIALTWKKILPLSLGICQSSALMCFCC